MNNSKALSQKAIALSLVFVLLITAFTGCSRSKGEEAITDTTTESKEVLETAVIPDKESTEDAARFEEDSSTTETTTATIKTSNKTETTTKKSTSSTSKGGSSTTSNSNSKNWGTSIGGAKMTGTAEQEKQARAVAKKIAKSIGPGTDLERVTKASEIVYSYYRKATYGIDSAGLYATAYGVFVAQKATCVGGASAMGMVLEEMGYSWIRCDAREDRFKSLRETQLGNDSQHQWCEVVMDGRLGWVDGTIGYAYYGPYGFEEMNRDNRRANCPMANDPDWFDFLSCYNPENIVEKSSPFNCEVPGYVTFKCLYCDLTHTYKWAGGEGPYSHSSCHVAKDKNGNEIKVCDFCGEIVVL